MISGSKTLEGLLKAMQQEQARMSEVDSSLNRSNDQLLALDAKRVAELGRLAQMRLRYLASKGAKVEGTNDEQVLKFVAQRDTAYQVIRQRQTQHEAKLAELDEARAAANAKLEAAMQAVDDAEAATQKRLETDPDYQKQLEAAHDADRVAQKAEAKATQSESEQATKGEAYRADPLFSYLWRRKYGTVEYRPGGFIFAPLLRYLDGRVARIASYLDARPNYARLLEIPVRLREHATGKAEAAEAAHAELERLDLQARQDGGVGALEGARDAAQAEVQGLDAQIEAATLEGGEIQGSLRRFAEGEDTDYQNAMEFLQSEFDRTPIEVLRAGALATPGPEDDLVVARLAELSKKREELAATVTELRASAEANRQRLQEITKLRADFTQAGMAQPNSSFRDGSAISSGISQYLAGMLTAQALWQLFGRQRTITSGRVDPTFGSGGFGRGTVWGGQPPRGGGGQVGDVLGSILDAVVRSQSGSSRRPPSGGGFGGGFKPSSGGFKPSGGSKPSGGGSKPSGGGMPKRGGFKTGGKF